MRARTDEPALLKSLREKARALSVPPDDLDQIAAPTAKDEHVARERVLLQHRLGLRRERREPPPHVRHACSQPDPRVRRNRDHTDRPRISRASASGS